MNYKKLIKTFFISILISSTVEAQQFLGPDQFVGCDKLTITLDAGAGYDEYLWSTHYASQTIEVGPGMYWAERRTIGTGTLTIASSTSGTNTGIINTRPGQSFTPTATGYLKSISYMEAATQTAYTTNFTLYKGAGFTTFAANISGVAVPSAASDQWFTFTFPVPYLVYKDSVYTWRIDTGGSDNVIPVADVANGYPGGSYYNGQGTAVTTTDLNFKADVTPVTIQRDTIAIGTTVCNGVLPKVKELPLTIYPNPVEGNEIHLEGEFVRIELRNAQGITVMVEENEGNHLSVNGVKQGIYFVQAEDKAGKIYSGKLVVE